MKGNGLIKEIFVLRSIGCLSIVMLHSILIALQSDAVNVTALYADILSSGQLLLNYGTPMFVFISEFVIAYSYRNKPVPESFFSKRLKFILIPYITMALVYAMPFFQLGINDWSAKALMNVFVGDYHGYFILIIFQFYIFHYYFSSKLKKLNPVKVISLSFIINFLYVAFFNLVPPPTDGTITLYIWDRFFWIPMIGWIFYFMIGFYAGTYYEAFIAIIRRHKAIILFLPFLTTILMLWNYHSGWLPDNTSKRMDIIFQTTAVSIVLFYIVHQLKYPPPFFVFISRYSFGIYLWHYAFLFIFDFMYVNWIPLSFDDLYFLILFLFSLTMSILTVKLFSKWHYGYMFIGKIGIPFHKQEKTPPAAS